jgi:hypothetical protein
LYSIVPVSDRTEALEWFGAFFGRPADEVLGEEYLWQVGENAWVVVDDRHVVVLDPDGNDLSLAEAPAQ